MTGTVDLWVECARACLKLGGWPKGKMASVVVPLAALRLLRGVAFDKWKNRSHCKARHHAATFSTPVSMALLMASRFVSMEMSIRINALLLLLIIEWE